MADTLIGETLSLKVAPNGDVAFSAGTYTQT